MIETDAPYLLPRTVKPMPKDRRNEPMYLAHIVEELARDRGEDVAATAAATVETSSAFFRLPVARAGNENAWSKPGACRWRNAAVRLPAVAADLPRP